MKPFVLSAAAIALLMAIGHAAEPETIDEAFQQRAGAILEFARAKDARNIGVLKFQVRIGDEPATGSAGELNLNLARRLTVALILALPDEKMGVIGNANEILAAMSTANTTSIEGRKSCFDGRGFTRAWNDRVTVTPDLFITGEAVLSKDRKTTTIKLVAFGEDGKEDTSIRGFTVPTSARTLIDTNHRYILTKKDHPDLFDGSKGFKEKTFREASQTESNKQVMERPNGGPTFERDLPVRVTVYYGDKPQSAVNGAIPEPKSDDKIWFKVENLSEDRYGVVLKINGVNTIFDERLPDAECHKWIVEPRKTIEIRGFQRAMKGSNDIVVLNSKQSLEAAAGFGPEAGTFRVTLFRDGSADSAVQKKPGENSEPTQTPKVDIKQQDAVAIARGVVLVKNIAPRTLAILQKNLRTQALAEAGGRGIAVPDVDLKDREVVKVPFSPNPPLPIVSYPIQYYKPAGK